MNGLNPENFLVQSSMLTGCGFLGVVWGGDDGLLTLRREKAEAKRRSETGGGVLGMVFSVEGGESVGGWDCWDVFLWAGPELKVKTSGGVVVSDTGSCLLVNPPFMFCAGFVFSELLSLGTVEED